MNDLSNRWRTFSESCGYPKPSISCIRASEAITNYIMDHGGRVEELYVPEEVYRPIREHMDDVERWHSLQRSGCTRPMTPNASFLFMHMLGQAVVKRGYGWLAIRENAKG